MQTWSRLLYGGILCLSIVSPDTRAYTDFEAQTLAALTGAATGVALGIAIAEIENLIVASKTPFFSKKRGFFWGSKDILAILTTRELVYPIWSYQLDRIAITAARQAIALSHNEAELEKTIAVLIKERVLKDRSVFGSYSSIKHIAAYAGIASSWFSYLFWGTRKRKQRMRREKRSAKRIAIAALPPQDV